MRKVAFVIIMLVCCSLCLCGCREDKKTVHFVVDDQTYEVIEQSGSNTVIPSAHPEKHGYVFDGWYLDKDIWENQVTTDFHAGKFENDAKIYAKWKPQNYSITYNLNGGVNPQDNPHMYNIESDNIILQAPTKHNAVFVGWFIDDQQVTGISKGSTGDRHFVAKWLDYDYVVSYDNSKTAEQNGSVLIDILNTAKDGSTVLVENGTYLVGSSMTMDKSLTVIGQSVDNTVIELSKDVGTMFVTIAGGGNDFVVKNINFKGYVGITHNNSSALKIGSSDKPNTNGNLVVENCKFSGFTKNSVTVYGGNASITNTEIVVREFVGASGNGIQIDMDAVATITGNNISCAISNAESWQSGGLIVLRGGKAVTVRDNVFTKCNVAVMLETYYDSPEHDTQLDEQAETSNIFNDCHWDVYRRAKS